MLSRLSIENYALIQNSVMEFGAGFTVITGETGAGKSILLGALGLLLGNRAETQVLWNKDKKCVVEAWFNNVPEEVNEILLNYDLDVSENGDLILRREILPGGKSRAFANDTPCGLSLLKAISEYIVDIHSQHQTLDLMRPSFLLEMIDAYIPAPEDVRDKYVPLYKEYQELSLKLDQLQQERLQWTKEQDYWKFLHEELESLSLRSGEQAQLESDLEKQEHQDLLRDVFEAAIQAWDAPEIGIKNRLEDICRQLRKASVYHQNASQALPRWESSLIELKDLIGDVERWISDLDFSPEQKAACAQRLDLIYKLESKHRLTSDEELIALQKEIGSKLKEADGKQEQEELLLKQEKNLREQLATLADTWSENRRRAADKLSELTSSALSSLGMEDAVLKIEQENLENFTANGTDRVRLLFNANKGGIPSDLSKVASGGELSRLMLALKSVIHSGNLIGCLILDEIDSGVSGEIAGKVAGLMQRMSKNIQLIAVTHLPQIAARASSHWRVYKQTDKDRTVSSIEILDDKSHLETIAAMISNEHITPQALMAAAALLKKV